MGSTAKRWLALLYAAAVFLAGCGGGSTSEPGGAPAPGTRTETTSALTLVVQASDGTQTSFVAPGNQLRLIATLERVVRTIRESDGAVVSTTRSPIAGEIVRFTAAGGSLSVANGQVLTDASGVATINYTAGAATGAYVLSAAASPVGLPSATATANIQIAVGAGSATRTEVTGALTLAVQDQTGAALNSLDEGVQARLVATLERITTIINNRDGSVVSTTRSPVPNEIVRFAAPGGTLNVANGQVLTGTDGRATVIYTAGRQTGAWTLTATASPADLGGLSASVNIQIVRILAGRITVAIVDESGTPATSLIGGRIYTVRALVERIFTASTAAKSQTGPVSGAVVRFSSDGGGFEPAAGTAITDSDGVASVRFRPNIVAATSRMNASASVNDTEVNGSVTYAIRVPSFRLGLLRGGQFTPGVLEIAQPNIPAGGQTVVRVDIVDDDGKPYLLPATVTFRSQCADAGTATVVSPVQSLSGTATSLYAARAGCEGTDLITATARADGLVFETSARGSLTIDPPVADSVEFLSATPRSLSLLGRGTAARPERSQVKFRVRNANGLAVPNTRVDFNLVGTPGGASIVTTPMTTDLNGEVVATLQAGGVPTLVRVAARIASGRSAQSDVILISTGTADAASVSLSSQFLNTESFNFDGVTSNLFFRVSDRFANPVQTTIYFTASGGQITPSCESVDGVCQVQWRSSAPRPPNGRVVILARAEGDESFIDLNGNSVYDPNETFVDLAEAFVDADEDGVFDAGETFFDRDSNGQWSQGNRRYDGLLCAQFALCGPSGSVDVRDSIVIVMSTSQATIRFVPNDPISVDEVTTADVVVEVSDRNGNLMAPGTRLEISSTNGVISGSTSYTFGDSNARGPLRAPLAIRGDGTPSTGAITVRVTSPQGVQTVAALPVTDTSVCNQPFAPLPAVCGPSTVGSITATPAAVQVAANQTVTQPIVVRVRDSSPQQRPWLGATVNVACTPAPGVSGYTVTPTGTVPPTNASGETTANLTIVSGATIAGTTSCAFSFQGLTTTVNIGP